MVNPVTDAGRMTSRRNAERYVRQGRARWVGPARIEFLEDDYRHLHCAQNKPRFIDGGLATLQQVVGLPVVVDPVSLLVIRRSDRGIQATPAFITFLKDVKKRLRVKRQHANRSLGKRKE